MIVVSFFHTANLPGASTASGTERQRGGGGGTLWCVCPVRPALVSVSVLTYELCFCYDMIYKAI